MSDDKKTGTFVRLQPKGIPLAKGYDPRRNIGGIPRVVFEARAALLKHLPTGEKVLVGLLADKDPKIRLGALQELYDWTLVKPKEGDSVHDRMREIFQGLRTKLDEATYRLIIEHIAEGGSSHGKTEE